MHTDYELFAFDLDGTLLARDGTIPPPTKEFIAHLSKASRVTLATGRSAASARPYLNELNITTPAVLYHGAVVFDPVKNRPLRELHVPEELACRAFEVSKRFPVHPQLYRSVDDPTVYVPKLTPPIEEFVRKESLTAELVQNFEKIFTQPPLKLLFIGTLEILPGFMAALREELPEVTVVRSARNYVEVLPPGVSKGEGLSWLCQYLRIPLSRTVAVGDQESDLSMIERAGLGVAMAEGADKLKMRADLVIERIEELKGKIKKANTNEQREVA